MFFVYHAYPTIDGKSLAGWTWHACNSENGFLHGRIVFFAFPIMCWIMWARNKEKAIDPSYWGMIYLVLGMLFFWASMRIIQPRLALLGFPLLVIGFTHYLFGGKIAKQMLFPAFFLWLVIPVPGLNTALTGRAVVWTIEFCYQTGRFLGWDLTREGSTLIIQEKTMVVRESIGIRLFAFTITTSAIFANYRQRGWWRKVTLFALSFPLLFFAGYFRILFILGLVQYGKVDFAMRFYHDWAGLLVIFPTVVLGMLFFGWLIKKRERSQLS